MTGVSTIGLDLAKMIFQVHGADASGAVVFRKTLRRTRVLDFFREQPRCVVAMEACGGAHYWARESCTVPIMAPQPSLCIPTIAATSSD